MKKNYLIALALVASMFSKLVAQSQRSCGTMHHLNEQYQSDPKLQDRMNQIERETQQWINQSGTHRTAAVITIPVVVHVVYKTATQNISDAQIMSQIAVLNEDFRKLNADVANTPSVFAGLAADCQIQFCLAQRDPSGNATSGIVRKLTSTTSFSDNDNVKRAANGGDDAWNSSQYLNIWVCNLGSGLLGYAQFPGGTASTDGVVILYSAFGRVGTLGAPYDKGRSATHEIGHWLNLRHIWGDASCGNDLVNDTPTQSTSNFGCPTFPHVTCSNGPNGDMFMNYMDYTDDACMFMFSTGQSSRMTASINASRAGLLTSLGCVPPSGTTCNVPASLTSGSITSGSAVLSWGAATGANSYNIQYRIVGSSTWSTASSATTSVSVSSLSASSNYEFQVQTVCSSGSSAFSASATFNTLTPATCNVPASLAASSITSATATLSWGAVSGATSYNIQYRIVGTSTWSSTSSSATSVGISGLTSSSNYEFQVQTICSGGSSAFSASATFNTAAVSTACDVPTNLGVSAITSSSATISWAVSVNATSYRVQYRINGSSTWTTTNAATTSKILNSLTAATTYQYRTLSICSSGNSAYTAILTFTTAAVSGCSDTYEPNNGTGTAKAISFNTDAFGLISTSTDNDYFKFTTVTGATNIKVTLDQLAADYDIRLLNSAGTLLTTSQNGGTTAESITRNTTAAASYFIRIYGYSGAFNASSCYRLNVSASGSSFREASESVSMQKMNGIDELNIYPNPTSDKLNFNFFITDNADVQFTVVDMLGKTVANNTLGAQEGFNQSSMDMSTLNNGIYFLRVQQNDQVVVRKFVVKH